MLVGGSIHIPKIQSTLQNHFCTKILYLSVNPDEVIAYEAAVQATTLSGDTSSEIMIVLLINVVPLSWYQDFYIT